MPEFGSVTCAGCALLCDDVTIEISSDGVRMRPECPLGVQWFSEAGAPAGRRSGDRRWRADGRRNGAPEGRRVAARRAPSAAPRIRGATVEDARAAVALADRLGALVSTGPWAGAWPGAPAVPLRGASTATLGEIRDRSQVVVVWREDPETTHPRLLERLVRARDSASDRALVVVDDRDTATAARADVRLSLPRERDLEALTILHVLQRGLEVRPDDLNGLMEQLRPSHTPRSCTGQA